MAEQSSRKIILPLLIPILLTPDLTHAASHLWVIHEVFSSADGTIQFIEMKECFGAPDETDFDGLWVRSNTNANTYFFTENLPPGSTANKHLLLATPGFAALPGAPTPDHIIPANFFSTDYDGITYFFFSNATLFFDSGELPLDGIHSLHQDGTVAVNSPTNFSDVTGSVEVGCEFVRGDVNFDGQVGLPDPIALLAFLFVNGPSPVPLAAGDADDDDAIQLGDALYLLTHLFGNGPPPLPPFPDPGCE